MCSMSACLPGISGVINSANVAKADLEEKYPGRKILVVDSLGASSGYGLFMDKLADLRDEGRPIEEVHAWAEEHKLNLHHWFFFFPQILRFISEEAVFPRPAAFSARC